MERNYYILNKALTTNSQDLKIGSRIIAAPISFNEKFEDGDGPFKTLNELKSKSSIYKNLKREDLSRAQKIVAEKNIFFIKDTITTPDVDIDANTINALIHSIKGRVKNKNITGVHFYDKSKIRITKLINLNLNGVFEAYFEFYNKTTNKWIAKRTFSTFFPKNWTIQRLFCEINYAISFIKVAEDGNYNSLTFSGIEVIINIKDGKVKTLYPVIK